MLEDDDDDDDDADADADDEEEEEEVEENSTPWFGLGVAFQSPLACSECPGSPSTFANAHILK